MPSSGTAFRVVAIAAAFVSLAACLETFDAQQGRVPATAAGGKSGVAEQVRARLHSQCTEDAGAYFRPDNKLVKQCDCFATAMVKSMRKEDLEFFVTYNVVPTLTVSRPEDVKKRCGMTVVAGGDPKAKLPAADGK